MKGRFAVAVLATVAVYSGASLLASAFTPAPDPSGSADSYFWLLALIGAAVVFLAVSAGSWISRGAFLLPALALWAVLTLPTLWLVYQLQLAAAPVSLGEFSLRNLPMAGATFAATLAGVAFGRFLARVGSRAGGTRAAT